MKAQWAQSDTFAYVYEQQDTHDASAVEMKAANLEGKSIVW